MLLRNGKYAGNGVDSRSIAAGFLPDLVLIANNSGARSAWRTTTITGDNAHYMDSNFGANYIESFNSNGFVIGTNSNTSGEDYIWLAVQDDGADFAQGSFTGNGTSQSITGLGFQPTYVNASTRDTANLYTTFKHVSHASGNSQHYDTADTLTSQITSIGADGFSVGSSAQVNSNANTTDWFAFKDTASKFTTGSYTGNGSDNRSITGIGFAPTFVIVKNASSATQAACSSDDLSDSSYSLLNIAASSDMIQAMEADGFQVGTHAAVNANGTVYYYMAWLGDNPPTTTTSTTTSSSTSTTTTTSTSTSTSTSTTVTSSSTTQTTSSTSTTSTSTSTTSTSTSTSSSTTTSTSSSSSTTTTSTTTTVNFVYSIDEGI